MNINVFYLIIGASRLPINRRQEVFPNGTLIIQDVQRGIDDGVYKCRAWNKQGQNAIGTVRVYVMGKDIFILKSFEIAIYIFNKYSITL